MEIAKTDVGLLQRTATDVDKTLKALDELELSLIGGGMGDVVFV